ncbi:MAG: TetR/AcrR family transcriptional regulator [Eubacterium sp.]|nr:TetR/AcrR family transcriptional regulator [Eubacterium sp.]
MDRRQKRTRQAVFTAFTGLLEKKSYSAITVQEIIEEADIGRSTFYSHFETKDDLLKALCTEIFDHVFSEKLTKENTHDFSSEKKDIRTEITHILYHLQDSRKYLKGILSSESGEMFMRYFKEYLGELFEDQITKYEPAVPADYMKNHMVCDFAETVRWWMENDSYSPEEISSFFFTSTVS